MQHPNQPYAPPELHIQHIVQLAATTQPATQTHEVFARVNGIAGHTWHTAPVDTIATATQTALHTLCDKVNQRDTPGRWSINIDPRTITQLDDTIHHIVEQLADSQQLDAEITENAPVANSNYRILGNWQALGIRILIDDYGTRHANRDRLTAFPWDGVKLDKTIVHHIAAGDTTAQRELAAILDTVEYIVAEGIETQDIADAMAQCGVTHGQGWLWHRAEQM